MRMHPSRNWEVLAAYPPADVTVERIGDLLSYELSNLRAV